MKFAVFVKAGLLGLAAAFEEPEGHEYQRNPGDSRSPCPGLNALANHGFLPRSGLDIDFDTYRAAIAAGFNWEPHAVDLPFEASIQLNLSTTGNPLTFHLHDQNLHNAIEFDGSLSRNDFALGDDHTFDPAIWHTVAVNLGLYNTGPSEAEKYVTVEVAAKARAARVKDAMAANPDFDPRGQPAGSPGTSALYMTSLWDDEVGAVPKAWIRALFEEERIPYLEGYNPATRKQKTFDDLMNMVQAITAVNTDPVKCKRKFIH